MTVTARAALLLALLSVPARAEPGLTEALGTASELLLPPFQAAALEHDLPAADLRFDGGEALMILGGSGLWRWQLALRSLKRLALGPSSGEAPLAQLGNDGLSWFAASDADLYQVNWDKGRVFHFALPVDGGAVLGFGGTADDYWLIHSAALMKIDRYGRTLRPRARMPSLSAGDGAVFAPETQTLWFTHETQLFKVDLRAPGVAPTLALTAKHPLLDLQRAGAGLIARTARAVLRIGPDGKLKRSIPVEGRRRLVAMHIGATAHAYLFDDHFLEIFRPAGHGIERYRLPYEGTEQPGRLILAGSYLALTIDGRPRVFHLLAKP